MTPEEEVKFLKEQLYQAIAMNSRTTREIDEVLRYRTREGIRFGEYPAEAVKRAVDGQAEEISRGLISLGRTISDIDDVLIPIIGKSTTAAEPLVDRVKLALEYFKDKPLNALMGIHQLHSKALEILKRQWDAIKEGGASIDKEDVSAFVTENRAMAGELAEASKSVVSVLEELSQKL